MRSYSYKTVQSGSEALLVLEKILPKIILLDIILPEIDGYEICKIIKADKKLKHVPIYHITASKKKYLLNNTCFKSFQVMK